MQRIKLLYTKFMKTLLSKITGVVASIIFSSTMFAQTSGTLTVVFTPTVPAGSTFYTGTTTKMNTLAGWIQNGTTFIKTGVRYWGGQFSNTGDHLPTWVGKSAMNVTGAITGATKAGLTPTTFTWNGTNTAGALQADGTYTIAIEDCWNHSTTAGPGINTSYLTFVKGPTASTVTPTATSWLTGISIIWTPSAVGVNEINVVNPVLSVYPNPTQGLFTIDFKNANIIKVFNMLGAVVFEEKIEQTTGSKQIDLTRFVNGVYFVNVSNGTNSSNQKIILNK